MIAYILGVSYIPYDVPGQKIFKNRKGYHHDLNYPKLIALVAVGGNKVIVCIGPAMRSALEGRKRIPKKIRDLLINKRPDQIEVIQKQNEQGITYYDITDESAKQWVLNSLA